MAGAAACAADHAREAAGRDSRSCGLLGRQRAGAPNGREGLQAACRAPALGCEVPRQGRAVGWLGARCSGPHRRGPVAPPARRAAGALPPAPALPATLISGRSTPVRAFSFFSFLAGFSPLAAFLLGEALALGAMVLGVMWGRRGRAGREEWPAPTRPPLKPRGDSLLCAALHGALPPGCSPAIACTASFLISPGTLAGGH